MTACARPPAPPPPKPPAAPVPDESAFRPDVVAFEPKWRGTSFGTYLAPAVDWAKEGGAVDVVFHFHSGEMADRAWRDARLKAVVVSAAFGMGSAPYAHAMRDPSRFGRMIDEVLASLAEAEHTGPLHLRRLGVVSFSAGFGAVSRILAQPAYFEQIDALVLLDSLHTYYSREHVPEVRGIEPYVRFAGEAKAGRKVMVITHSSIQPPDYPSSTESTAVLLDAVGARRVDETTTTARGMSAIYRADAGNLHVFGFRGETAKDHMNHLFLVGDLVREYVARRWARLEALDRRAPQG